MGEYQKEPDEETERLIAEMLDAEKVANASYAQAQDAARARHNAQQAAWNRLREVGAPHFGGVGWPWVNKMRHDRMGVESGWHWPDEYESESGR